MKSKLLIITAMSLALSASFATAQTNGGSTAGGAGGNGANGSGGANGTDAGSTSATGSSGGEDTSGYLSGPNIREFFTDNNGMTLRPANEMQERYGRMSSDEQSRLKAACASNSDAKYNELCSSVGAM